MPPYVVSPMPSNMPQEKHNEAVWRELLALQRATTHAEDVILTYLHVAPRKVLPGMLVLADGTDWNPGSGEGAYRRNKANSAWIFLG